MARGDKIAGAQGTFKVVGVSERTRDWTAQQGGPMRDYYLRVEGPGTPALPPADQPFALVTLSQKVSTTPPKVGDTLDGQLEDGGVGNQGPFPPKLRKSPPARGGGGGGYGPKSPEERRSIEAQTAIKTAGEITVALIEKFEGQVTINDAGNWFADLADIALSKTPEGSA